MPCEAVRSDRDRTTHPAWTVRSIGGGRGKGAKPKPCEKPETACGAKLSACVAATEQPSVAMRVLNPIGQACYTLLSMHRTISASRNSIKCFHFGHPVQGVTAAVCSPQQTGQKQHCVQTDAVDSKDALLHLLEECVDGRNLRRNLLVNTRVIRLRLLALNEVAQVEDVLLVVPQLLLQRLQCTCRL
jgi:hypothetical protein